MKKLKISVSMIVKNEEEMLEDCLKTISGFDEIVISDTGSEDRTVEIAKKYTDKVYTDYKWRDNFAEARNVSKSKCTGDWIFVIDADETLEVSVEDVRNAVKKAEEGGYQFINVQMEGRNKKNIHTSQRLFKNIPEIEWKGAAHNYLEYKGKKPIKKYDSDIKMIYGYSPAHKRDPNRTLRILKKAVEEDNTMVREKFYLAREYFYKKDYKKCIELTKDYLKTAYWKPEIAEAYIMKAKCYWMLGGRKNANLAIESCIDAIRINPDFKEAFVLISEMYYSPLKEVWLEHAKACKNTGVLFIRTK